MLSLECRMKQKVISVRCHVLKGRDREGNRWKQLMTSLELLSRTFFGAVWLMFRSFQGMTEFPLSSTLQGFLKSISLDKTKGYVLKIYS